ncbi:hypothetical protein N0V94_000537 [Neodidymelliopsis sp. IMI 364377]|nr:hypothetical protein N0V94_000537 [Neodidymelliopsis sp. IMI 364377]
MGSSEDDEDFKLALALSMQHSRDSTPTQNAIVDLTSDNEGEDDDDDDLREAIALSLNEAANTPASTKLTDAIAPSNESATPTIAKSAELTQQTVSKPPVTTQTPKASGIVGIDRKAMELERLARLSKRKREPSPDRPSKQLLKAPPTAAMHTSAADTPPRSDPVLQYPNGAIKRTFAHQFPRTDDIKLDELLEASIVNIAVISAFQWDAKWLNRKLNPAKVKQIWIMNAKGADVQARWKREMAQCGIPNLRLHFPPMDGSVRHMHSKFMLLFSEKKLRVVVSTANMQKEDWGEVGNDWQPGVMENTVFIIDLPRRVDGVGGKDDVCTNFMNELINYLEAQNLDEKVIDGVLKFDFSQTKNLAFVHSM